MSPQVYVVNRAVDAERMARFRRAAEALDLPFEREEAIDGHDPDAPLFLYRDYLPETFWGGAEIKPGAFACALSHRAAWMRFLASGAEMALICEDDAPLVGAPADLFRAAARAKGWDVVFANGRMAAWREEGAAKSDPRLLPLPRVASRLAKKGVAPKAPGADCYLVSRKGAKALTEALARSGVAAGVDWLIVAAALGPGALPGEEYGLIDEMLGADRAPTIEALVWSQPLADAKSAKPSAINHKETAAIADMRSAPSISIGEGGGALAPRGLRPDPVSASFDGERFYEEPALEMMARWMLRGGVFVDVGAHIGGHTLFMLRHGGAGAAIPFEQNRFAIEAFHEAMALNGLSDRVDAAHLGFGLGEEAGKREAKGARRNPFAQRLKRGFDEAARIRPGDVLLREADVDMIKLDVNGEEREVLKGLKKTLKRKAPLLALDLTRHRSVKALPLLERLGYVEIERAVWREGEVERVVALYRSTKGASRPKPASADP